MSSVALLAGLTACGNGAEEESEAGSGQEGAEEQAAADYPEQILNVEELESLLPTDEELPEGYELGEEGVNQQTQTPEEYAAEIEESFLAHMDESIQDLDGIDGEPGAEECRAAVEERIEQGEERLEELEEDPPEEDLSLAFALYSAEGVSADAAVYPQERTVTDTEIWLAAEEACAELPVGNWDADAYEEITVGSAPGFVAHEGDNVVILLEGVFGGTNLELYIEGPSDQEEQLLEDAEQIVEHVEGELVALAEES